MRELHPFSPPGRTSVLSGRDTGPQVAAVECDHYLRQIVDLPERGHLPVTDLRKSDDGQMFLVFGSAQKFCVVTEDEAGRIHHWWKARVAGWYHTHGCVDCPYAEKVEHVEVRRAHLLTSSGDGRSIRQHREQATRIFDAARMPVE